MTIGIYKISFGNSGLVYVGQSMDMERRIQTHKRKFALGTAAKKLQQAYALYGTPTFSILEVCGSVDLDVRERWYISEYNSVECGLNTTIGGFNNFGASASAAYYNADTYLEILELLVKSAKSNAEIADELEVSELVVKHISDLSRHSWLQEAAPENYSKLVALRNIGRKSCAISKGIVYPNIVSPSGEVFQVYNTRKFSETHNLPNGALCAVLNGRQKYVKGWRLEGTDPIPPHTRVVSPEGFRMEIPYRGVRKFCDKHGLSATCMGELISGKAKSHKGWALFKENTQTGVQ